MKGNEFDKNDYLKNDERIYKGKQINYKILLTNKAIYIISLGDQDIKEGDILRIDKNNISISARQL